MGSFKQTQFDLLSDARERSFASFYDRQANRVARYEGARDYLPHTPSPRATTGNNWGERFAKFHAENPHVFEVLHRLALRLKGRGVNRYGIKALFEVVRFEYAISTAADNFKMNNNFAPYYARELMKDHRLSGFFQLRRSAADVD